MLLAIRTILSFMIVHNNCAASATHKRYMTLHGINRLFVSITCSTAVLETAGLQTGTLRVIVPLLRTKVKYGLPVALKNEAHLRSTLLRGQGSQRLDFTFDRILIIRHFQQELKINWPAAYQPYEPILFSLDCGMSYFQEYDQKIPPTYRLLEHTYLGG